MFFRLPWYRLSAAFGVLTVVAVHRTLHLPESAVTFSSMLPFHPSTVMAVLFMLTGLSLGYGDARRRERTRGR